MSAHQTVEDIRGDILSSAAAVRSAALLEHDEWRLGIAARIENMFTGVAEAADLRDRAADCLRLYGGMGSFADVGTETMADAVAKLRMPLVRARIYGID